MVFSRKFQKKKKLNLINPHNSEQPFFPGFRPRARKSGFVGGKSKGLGLSDLCRIFVGFLSDFCRKKMDLAPVNRFFVGNRIRQKTDTDPTSNPTIPLVRYKVCEEIS